MIEPVEIVADRLCALPLAFPLDRPRSAFPPSARGFGTVNCYLLKEGDRALLVDTGFPPFRRDLLAMLDRLDATTTLSVIVLRAAEASALGNLFTILEERDVDQLYGAIAPSIVYAFDSRTLAERNPAGLRKHGYRQLGQSQTIELSPGRRLEVFKPMLQLLNQLWIYDEETRTLFTSEYFGHVVRETAAGPWTVDDPDADPTTPESLAEFLRLGNRTWWLAGADGEALAAWVGETFATRTVECIAPSFGAILRGREVVERHVGLMQEALRLLAREPLQAVTAP